MVRHHHLRNVRLSASISGALVALGALVAPAGADTSPGIELMRDSTKGNCSICHLVPGIGLPEDAQGTIGPSLEGVGARLSPEELSQQVADARRINPNTVMPPYGTTEGLVDVDRRYLGRPILTDSEIAAIVAYLSGLR
jgi:sulfur-oxidizing protein SoxX